MREFWLDVLGSLMVAVISPVVTIVLFPLNYLFVLTRPFGRRIPGIKKAYEWWEDTFSGHAYIQIGLDY